MTSYRHRVTVVQTNQLLLSESVCVCLSRLLQCSKDGDSLAAENISMVNLILYISVSKFRLVLTSDLHLTSPFTPDNNKYSRLFSICLVIIFLYCDYVGVAA